MSNSQAPNANGEILLAKYLTDSIRSLEQAIRKTAPIGNLPRSLSAPRLDLRSDGRRPATEVLLPRKLPLAQAPAAAAALAVTRRDDFGHTIGGPGRPGGQVVTTQARLLQPGQLGYSAPPPPLPPRSHGGVPLPPRPVAAVPPPPLPPKPAVVRTAHAIAAALQNQPAYGRNSGGGAAGRSTSAPRMEDVPHTLQQHHHQHQRHHSHEQQYGAGHARRAAPSEARIPAVAAAPPLAGLLVGGGGNGHDTRSAAPVRCGAPSEAGSHSSWWRWKPVTDASYPMTAVTDRYAASMSPSEVIRWNDRVARLEAEITQEKQRRRQFEEQLKKLQVATSATAQAQGPGAARAAKAAKGAAAAAAVSEATGTAPPFR